ncbi:hypothetical protein MMC10_002503 [Thelotrema lepadinum]|nr:hypothetical protein [Thelotrema lepadinum]
MSKFGNGSFKASLLNNSGLRTAATSSPSPAPSQVQASSNETSKPKQTTLKTDGIWSQPADTGTGTSLLTQISFTIKRLQQDGKSWTLEGLISYLSLHVLTEQETRIFAKALRDHPSISYDPNGLDGQGSYTFKSRYDIHEPSQLLRHLQGLPTFHGLPANDLKEGWAESEEAIRTLEDSDKLLVLRSRKDEKAKMVWLDDPTLCRRIDSEFRDIWGKIKLPDPETTAADLERNGLLPTNKSKKPNPAGKSQVKKQKKSKRSGKVTNQHISHMLKDYSNRRK